MTRSVLFFAIFAGQVFAVAALGTEIDTSIAMLTGAAIAFLLHYLLGPTT